MTKNKKKKTKKTDLFSAPFLWFFVTIAMLISASYAFHIFEVANLFSNQPLAARFFESNYWLNNQLLVYHIYLAVPACLIGPFMFHEQLRNNNLWWHRQLGKAYIICCCASAATGLLLALGKPNPIAAGGFSTLATLWFVTSYLAYKRARSRNFKSHRRWMIRSFALTFAFFTVKMWDMGLDNFTTLDDDTAMGIKSWAAWVPNLTVMEIYIWSTTPRGKWNGFMKTLKPAPRETAGH